MDVDNRAVPPKLQPTDAQTASGPNQAVNAGRLVNRNEIDAVELVEGGLRICFTSRSVDLHPLWLRERSTSLEAADPHTGQRLFEPHDLPRNLAVVWAEVDDSVLDLRFDDGHRMRLDLHAIDGLRAQRDMDASARPEDPPRPVPWTAPSTEVPLVDYRLIAGRDRTASAAELHRALRAHFELGFFVLTGTPAQPGALHEITSHFGRISATNFGVLFDVRSEPMPVDLAYTALALSAHTDQPYRSPTPGLQFLHTIVNDAPGGASTIVDGLAAVQDLAAADPEAHAVLCTLPVEFRYDIGTDVKVHTAPVIERNPDGSLRQLRFSPRLDYAPLADRLTLDRYYRGRRWLATALNDPARRLEYPMQAGDTLVVDNHRVLHGRTAFDPTRGHRHLQGCYIDHDGPVTAWILAHRNQEASK